jgi:uncharacterized membrane protein
MTMMGYGAGLGFGFGSGGVLVALGCIAVLVGLVLLAAWAVGRSGQGAAPATTPGAAPTPPAAAQPDAMDVLRMRLARGEITVDEYAAAKSALEAGR